MRNELGDIRRSQVIVSHGPGAIVDFRAGGWRGAGVSAVSAGLEEWDHWARPEGLGHPQTISEPRLERKLGVAGFRLPPVAPQRSARRQGTLVAVRFPRWLQCPRCHLLLEAPFWSEDPGDPALYCAECSQEAGGRNRAHVVPARFIIICDAGHLGEFPWDWWVRHEPECSGRSGRRSRKLRLDGSAVAGLAGLILTCLSCGARRSMEGCFAQDAIPAQCQGQRPWLGADADEDCSRRPRVVQRGASNIYFSVVDSALDIPPWSDELQKKIGRRWTMLAEAPDRDARKTLIGAMRLAEITGRSESELMQIVDDRLARLQSPDRNIRWEEYQQFIQHDRMFGENTEFEIRPAPAPAELARCIRSIVRATRLREVRVLRGFTRVVPPTPGDDQRVAQISLRKLDWLPAVENRGEGVFIQLRNDRVRDWEKREPVQQRVSQIRASYEKACRDRQQAGSPAKLVTPRFLLIHSLAHALIRQLSLSCGYGTASLRERLFVDSDHLEMTGLLVFTSSPDADGTLGGLARQGEAENIVSIFEGALASATWCSSDPLCIDDVHGTTESANGAACHACMLAPETSCEEFNRFLDRALLVGTPSQPELGYFCEVLEQLRAEAGAASG